LARDNPQNQLTEPHLPFLVPEGARVLGDCDEDLSDEGRAEAAVERGLHSLAGMDDFLSS
jgi:hypothetical protein